MSSESTVTYRYEFSQSFKKKGVKHVVKEEIIDGEKGMFFKLLTKKGEEFYRIEAKEDENNKDKFLVKEKKGETETQKEVSLAELKKIVATDNLEFVKKYITKDRDTYKGRSNSISLNELLLTDGHIIETGGAKKRSKKASKKVSKKASKKTSKKGSKKQSGGAKKRSKKASKKASKKGSKKASKKVSKKRSKKQSGGAKKRSKKTSKKASKKASKKVSRK
jgi:hypothetical protein